MGPLLISAVLNFFATLKECFKIMLQALTTQLHMLNLLPIPIILP